MDQSQQKGNTESLLQSLEFLISGIIVAGVVFVIFLGVLNYLNLISLSEILPNLSFLPHQTQPTQLTPKIVVAAQPTLPPNFDESQQNGPYRCPTSPDLCQRGLDTKDNTLSTKLPINAPMYAAFDGIVEVMPSVHPTADGKSEAFNIALLVNEVRGLQAMYYYKGTIIPKKTVKPGELIATSNGQPIHFMEDKTFVFRLLKLTDQGSVIAQLSPTDFIK